MNDAETPIDPVDAVDCSVADGAATSVDESSRSDDALDPNLRAMFWRYEKIVVLINHKIGQKAKDYTYAEACDDCDYLDKIRQQIVAAIVDQEKKRSQPKDG